MIFMEFTAEQIAGFLNGKIEGDPTAMVNDVSKIEEGRPGTLAFLACVALPMLLGVFVLIRKVLIERAGVEQSRRRL